MHGQSCIGRQRRTQADVAVLHQVAEGYGCQRGRTEIDGGRGVGVTGGRGIGVAGVHGVGRTRDVSVRERARENGHWLPAILA